MSLLAFYSLPIFLILIGSVYLVFRLKKVLFGSWSKKRWLPWVVSITLSAGLFYMARNMLSFQTYLVGLLIICFLITDVLRFIAKRFVKSEKWFRIAKRIYARGAFAFLLMAVILLYGYINIRSVKITEYNIEAKKFTQGQNLKVGLISDIHLGTTMNAEELDKHMDRLKDKSLDMLILAGDIFDESTNKEEMIKACEILGSVKTTYGSYYVYGNHDLLTHGRNAEITSTEIANHLTNNGITVLRENVALVADSFYLIGRTDAWHARQTGRKSIEELVSKLDSSKYMILIDHQPLELKKAASLGIDLHLSGHTHGGQIWFLGVLNELTGRTELNYGLREDGAYRAIVSSGMGGWKYPQRILSRSEMVILNIGPERVN